MAGLPEGRPKYGSRPSELSASSAAVGLGSTRRSLDLAGREDLTLER